MRTRAVDQRCNVDVESDVVTIAIYRWNVTLNFNFSIDSY